MLIIANSAEITAVKQKRQADVKDKDKEDIGN
jgi:hypothetical protein